MTDKLFVWKAASSWWKGPAGYVHLESGKEYKAGDFPPGVVGHWVKTGAATWKAGKSRKENN